MNNAALVNDVSVDHDRRLSSPMQITQSTSRSVTMILNVKTPAQHIVAIGRLDPSASQGNVPGTGG